MLLLPPIVLAKTAFRPERGPQILLVLNDLCWLMFITPFPLSGAQNLGIAIGTLMERRPDPFFPRWLAYLNLWVALLFAPGGQAIVFETGPYAWPGRLAFWAAAGVFATWFIAMTVMLLKAVGAEQSAAS